MIENGCYVKHRKRLAMKKICILLIIVFITIELYDVCFLAEKKAPTETAVWIGDYDFGCWYDILYLDSVNYITRIKVYHDYDEGIWNDAYYMNENKSITPFTRQNIINSILDFDVSTNQILLKQNNDTLFLLYNHS